MVDKVCFGKVLSMAPILDPFLEYIEGLVQDCSNSIANALELQHYCTKPSICALSGGRQRHR